MSEALISIKNKEKFCNPLSSLCTGINQIIFSINNDTFHINAISDDGSQRVNLHYTSDIVEISNIKKVKKLGIYNLSEFLNVLSLCDKKEIDIKVKDNKLIIGLGKTSKINYILTDIDLITEGAEDLKKVPDFNVEFEIDENFIKKIKGVSRSLNVNILKFIIKDSKLYYKITDKNEQSHDMTELLSKDIDCSDFSISICLKDDNRDNLSLLCDGLKYKISLHPKIIQLEVINDDYDKIRYFLAPMVTDN